MAASVRGVDLVSGRARDQCSDDEDDHQRAAEQRAEKAQAILDGKSDLEDSSPEVAAALHEMARLAEDIRREVLSICGGEPLAAKTDPDRPVAVVKWVDGTLLDTVYKVHSLR